MATGGRGTSILTAHSMMVLPVLMLTEGTAVSGSVTSTASLVCFTTTVPTILYAKMHKQLELIFVNGSYHDIVFLCQFLPCFTDFM